MQTTRRPISYFRCVLKTLRFSYYTNRSTAAPPLHIPQIETKISYTLNEETNSRAMHIKVSVKGSCSELTSIEVAGGSGMRARVGAQTLTRSRLPYLVISSCGQLDAAWLSDTSICLSPCCQLRSSEAFTSLTHSLF